MNAHQCHAVIRSTRPPFLLLTPACLLLALGSALYSGASLSLTDVVLLLLGALFAHISVNTFNEYFDFRSGLDNLTQKTPFSGGSGALVDVAEAAPWVLSLAIASLALTAAIGLYFLFQAGAALLPLGTAGILIIVTYTQWLNRQPLLCLLAPGVGFGPLMVIGAHLVLTNSITDVAGYVSLVPLCLVSNLLLLNQLPDIDADRRVGRRHFPIVYGVDKSLLVYLALSFTAVVIIITGVVSGILPSAALLSLLPLSLTFVVFPGARKHTDDIPGLLPYLGVNVAATLLTPIVLGGTLIACAW